MRGMYAKKLHSTRRHLLPFVSLNNEFSEAVNVLSKSLILGFHQFYVIKTKNRNHSLNKVENLG